MNTMNTSGIELDGATLTRIDQAAGRWVDFPVLLSTPAGNFDFITVKARNRGKRIQFRMPKLP